MALEFSIFSPSGLLESEVSPIVTWFKLSRNFGLEDEEKTLTTRICAQEWTFELGDGKVLVLDPTKTRRSGWIGRALCKYPHASIIKIDRVS